MRRSVKFQSTTWLTSHQWLQGTVNLITYPAAGIYVLLGDLTSILYINIKIWYYIYLKLVCAGVCCHHINLMIRIRLVNESGAQPRKKWGPYMYTPPIWIQCGMDPGLEKCVSQEPRHTCDSNNRENMTFRHIFNLLWRDDIACARYHIIGVQSLTWRIQVAFFLSPLRLSSDHDDSNSYCADESCSRSVGPSNKFISSFL